MQATLLFTWPDVISDRPLNIGPLNALSAIALQAQALLATSIAHPLWAIVLLVLGIGLLQLIADLMKRFVKAFLKFVLTLPLTLSQWIWKRATTTSPEPHTQRINQLLARLDTLRQEQDQVVDELKATLAELNPDISERSPAQLPTQPPEATGLAKAQTALTRLPSKKSSAKGESQK